VTITADSVVVDLAAPDMSRDAWNLSLAGTPARFDSDAAYDRIRERRGSHAFARSIFTHESSDGTQGICKKYDTKSPGNTRSSRNGKGHVITTEKGPYAKYDHWDEGFDDVAWRISDPSYVYAQEGRRTIRQIIERFAPATDNNVPERYIAAVVSDMNAWITEAPPMAGFEMPASINGIPVRKSFIPSTNSNRPGTPANAEGRTWITVHETANFNTGANAEMHRKYTHNGGGASPGNDGVSFTFVVDDHEIVWLLPLEETSWQASDGANGTGNSSASIETCVNADGDWNRTKENLAHLVAFLGTDAPGRSIDRVAQHNKWARDQKNCPTRLRANNGAEWNALMARVRDIAEGAPEPPPSGDWPTVPPAQPDPWRHSNPWGGNWWIPRAFVEAINTEGFMASGYVMSEAFPETTDAGEILMVQYFERKRWEIHENGAITAGLVGAEAMWSRYPERKAA